MSFTKVKSVIENTRANLDRARRMILTPRRLEVTMGERRKKFSTAFWRAMVRVPPPRSRAHINSVMAELIAFARDNASTFADGDQLSREPAYATFPFG